MNKPRDDDGKASLLQAFIDAVALRTHDEEGDDDSRLSARPKDECRIAVGRRIHPTNKPTPRRELPSVVDPASGSNDPCPPCAALTTPLEGGSPRMICMIHAQRRNRRSIQDHVMMVMRS
jgi:hypothetical protein